MSILEEERGVSPVIGVILMVAITVILAAVIAAFVLQMGDEGVENAPGVGFEYDESTAGPDAYTIQHRSGDDVEADSILLKGGFAEAGQTWADVSSTLGPDDTVSAGAEITVTSVTGDIQLIWIDSKGEDDTILSSYTPD